MLQLPGMQGGDLDVYGDGELEANYYLEPDAYTTSCMVFLSGMIDCRNRNLNAAVRRE